MTLTGNRREILTGMAGAGVAIFATSVAGEAQTTIQPSRGPGHGGSDPGPQNLVRELQNPDIVNPPATDQGTLPNLRFSFSDSHVRQESGGWARQVTKRELGISEPIAGVNMRLNENCYREMHWHKEGEWAYMLYGSARINAIDANGNVFMDDVGVGDLWYFPPGIPHAIQGLGADGCEFLLVFDDGGFDEDSTFLISDWFKHIPPEILAKNFGVDQNLFTGLHDPSTLYMFPGTAPGSLETDRPTGAAPVPDSFSFKMATETPIQTKSGSVRIIDSSKFKISKTISAALVEIEPGGMRELHWHPNTDEWQYYIEGQARMGVFAASGTARTFDYTAGDVGYVPYAMGHYVENTGTTTLRFLEMFRSSYYADISLNQWMALSPQQQIRDHLGLSDQVLSALSKKKLPIVPA